MNIERISEVIVGHLWGPIMIVLCMGIGIYYSASLGFPQIRHLKSMVASLSKSQTSQSGITPFQSFAMALGGRVGVGSIAGVATAIAFGGPGSIFWMWIYAFLGSAAAFGESVLAQIWKEEVNGEYRGGPAYYLKKSPLKFLGILSAYAGILANCFTGPSIQAFNIADSFQNAFNIKPWITGLVVAVLFAAVVLGGMKRIGKFAEFVVPFMAGVFLLLTLIILGINAKAIPAMFAQIFKSALNMEAAFGGMFGSAIIWGIKRGVYSSEAGMGSGANAAAAAEVSHPIKQGLAQAFSVYGTLVVCTCTALMILVTNSYNVFLPSGEVVRQGLPGVEAGVGYAQAAINTLAPGTKLGAVFIAIAMFLFALTTLLSFGFYAQVSIAALFDKSAASAKKIKTITFICVLIQLCSIYLGSIKSATLIWNICDIGVGTLTWLNIIGMAFLIKPVRCVLKDFERQKAQGLDPVFVPSACGIKEAELWDTIVQRHYKDMNNSTKHTL